jgi:hypothetical protein
MVAACALHAADAPKPAPRVEVIFDSPENYTDWKLSWEGPEWYRDAIFSAVRSFLVKVTDPMLPDGYNLKITFTDMGLGNRSSRHVPSSSGAPAFEFTYSVTDPSGTVVRKGTENFMFYWDLGNDRFTIDTTDLTTEIIRYEKPMLMDWACTRLADLKKRRFPPRFPARPQPGASEQRGGCRAEVRCSARPAIRGLSGEPVTRIESALGFEPRPCAFTRIRLD